MHSPPLRLLRGFVAAWLLAGGLALAEEAPPPAASASAVQAAIQQLRDEEHFGRKHPERYLRFKPDEKKDKKAEEKKDAAPWLRDFLQWLNGIGRAGVWTLGALGLGVVAVIALRAAQRSAAAGARVGVHTAPTSVRQYDIRPESLPADIGSAAWAQWQAGEQRPALVLLYRGALSRLVHRHGVPIRGSSTEGECMALASRHLADHRSDYFARVTRARLLASYADRWPQGEEMHELCRLFERALAPVAAPMAEADAAGAAA